MSPLCVVYFIVPFEIFPWEIRAAFSEESQLRQSRSSATQPITVMNYKRWWIRPFRFCCRTYTCCKRAESQLRQSLASATQRTIVMNS